jgi:leucyl aminopeptidase (aminopeptidase T)
MPSLPGSPSAVGRALVGPALELRRGEHLVVATWNHTLPWATAVVEEARRIGAVPLLLLEDEATFWRSVEGARSVRHWSGISPTVRAALRRADALVHFPGPADRPRLHALPPELLAPFLQRDDQWFRLARATGVRGVRCLLGYASDAQAEHWGVPGALWRSRLIRGIGAADYDAIGRDAARAARLLRHGRELRVSATNGTEMRIGLRGRTPWVDDGRVDAEDRRRGRSIATAPAGLVVVAVGEGSAQGTAVANRPSYLASGRADGAQWEVEGGMLRNYWYSDGAEAFESEFASAPRGREVVALFAIGLNPALAPGVPQAEDLEAGTVTLAIGGNTLYGGRNRCRFLSWITVGEATVSVDGTPLCDRGKFL